MWSIASFYNWDYISTAPKAAIKHIIAAQPPARKSRIADALRLEKTNLKDDFFGFSAYVAERTVQHTLLVQRVPQGRSREEDREAKGHRSSCTIQFGISGKEKGRQTTALPQPGLLQSAFRHGLPKDF